MAEAEEPLNYFDALPSLGLYKGRIKNSHAVEQALAGARQNMVCVALEGEPGIGKTRLLFTAAELARERGFTAVAVTADEEIQGPFLAARSIFSSPEIRAAALGTQAEDSLERLNGALSNRDEEGLENLPSDRKLLRTFDLAAIALRALAAQSPLAILLDDMQWADEDSLRLLRYVVRVDTTSPILIVFAMRASETAFVNEAVTLLADLDRMGILRRLKLDRFSQLETTEFLQQVLGGPISLPSAATMHAQAEGVPFVLAEQARAYRDAGLIQVVDGVWTLARNAERLLPGAVKTLIRRRGSHLSDDTKLAMGEAGILGRNFSLRDLREIKRSLGDEVGDTDALSEVLVPAVAAGLLIRLPPGSPADYSFAHEQIRQYAVEELTPTQQRAVHASIVQMFTTSGEHSVECSALLAQHALAAGQTELASQCSIEAATAALAVHAGEEALRLVDIAQPVASSPQARVELLRLRDGALDMLRRPAQRLEGLSEMAALADALGDSHLSFDVMLRRAAALREAEEHEQAAEIARRVRELAVDAQDQNAELAACLELGQDLMRTEIGEGYTQSPAEADLEGAAEAYKQAKALAESLGDERELAAAVRELGIIALSRVRIWFLDRVTAGEIPDVVRRITGGDSLEDILSTLPPVAPMMQEAGSCFHQALEIYERLGDRQGAMVTLFAMATLTWAPEIHLTGSPKRIEELHRMMMRLKSLTKESERALAEAQVLFGAHVYARAKAFPDAAIVKGKEAHAAARVLGDSSLEFVLAGGVAMALADVGEFAEAEEWISRAAGIGLAEPTPLRARHLESWRGLLASASGNTAGMREHLSRAVELATDQGQPAARCEALAELASQSARHGKESGDDTLLELGEQSAREAMGLLPVLPGHPTWGAKASAALARVKFSRGQEAEALEAARVALEALDAARTEDPSFDILLPAAEVLMALGDDQESTEMRDRLHLMLTVMAQRILDEDIRVRWFQTSTGRELARLAGPLDQQMAPQEASALTSSLSSEESRLLQLLAEGRSNREIADELGESEGNVMRRFTELYMKIGASSRADATAAALMGKLV
jgi:DNA-binding CsgD family transcriptional regulator/tetratricopeptide (TPR) repeat protein